MTINEKSYAYGAQKSSIREIAAYGSARKAQIGAENVFDFSLGNPSIPAPESVRASIARALELPPTQLHGYTPAQGLPSTRAAVAAKLNRDHGTSYTAADLYLTMGAAAALVSCQKRSVMEESSTSTSGIHSVNTYIGPMASVKTP